VTRRPPDASRARTRDRVWESAADPAEPPLMRRPAVYLLGAATVVVWGLNWPIMAEGITRMPPEWLAAFRLAGAAVLMGVIMATRHTVRLPSRHDLPIVLSVGVVGFAVVTTTVFAALRFVPPGRSSIVVYSSTLWTAPMAAIVLSERLTRYRVIGLLCGCTGLVLLLAPWSLDWSDGRTLTGVGLLLFASVMAAAVTVHVRAHSWRGTPLQLMPWLLGVGALPIVILAFAIHGPPHVAWTPSTLAIVTYQIVLASAFAEWGAVTLTRSVPAISATLILMAVPVVGLLSSIAFVDESASAADLISLVLVLGGVALGVLSDRRSGPPIPLG
jgi:drug/metabolite transporter (DMT)-like permease